MGTISKIAGAAVKALDNAGDDVARATLEKAGTAGEKAAKGVEFGTELLKGAKPGGTVAANVGNAGTELLERGLRATARPVAVVEIPLWQSAGESALTALDEGRARIVALVQRGKLTPGSLTDQTRHAKSLLSWAVKAPAATSEKWTAKAVAELKHVGDEAFSLFKESRDITHFRTALDGAFATADTTRYVEVFQRKWMMQGGGLKSPLGDLPKLSDAARDQLGRDLKAAVRHFESSGPPQFADNARAMLRELGR